VGSLIRKTAVICLTSEDFELVSQLRHKEGVHEFFHVTTLASLNEIDFLTDIIFLASSKELSEFVEISTAVGMKGVTQRWQ
jgi:hypothetical protein